METITYFLYKITHHEIWVIILALLLFFLSLTRKKRIVFGILILVLAVLNILFGYRLANYMIYTYGQSGTAVITATAPTNDIHNYQPIVEFQVSIDTKDAQKINTTFRSDDFNLYPTPKRGYRYPGTGIPFTVKYLKQHPDVFIIVSK